MFFLTKLFVLITVLCFHNTIYASTVLQRLEDYNDQVHRLRTDQQPYGTKDNGYRTVDDVADEAFKLFTDTAMNCHNVQRADAKSRKAIRTAIIHRIMGQPEINRFDLEESIHVGHNAAVAFIHRVVLLLRQDNASFLFNIDDVVRKVRANQADIFQYLNVPRNAHWLAVDQRQSNCSDDQIKKILGKHFMTQYLDGCRYYRDVERQDIINVRDIDDGVIGAGTKKPLIDPHEAATTSTPLLYSDDRDNITSIRLASKTYNSSCNLPSAVHYNNYVYVNYDEYYRSTNQSYNKASFKSKSKSTAITDTYNIAVMNFMLSSDNAKNIMHSIDTKLSTQKPHRPTSIDITLMPECEEQNIARDNYIKDVNEELKQLPDYITEHIKELTLKIVNNLFSNVDPRLKVNQQSRHYQSFIATNDLREAALSIIREVETSCKEQNKPRFYNIYMESDCGQRQNRIEDYLKECLIKIKKSLLCYVKSLQSEIFHACYTYSLIVDKFDRTDPRLVVDQSSTSYKDFIKKYDQNVKDLEEIIIHRLPLSTNEQLNNYRHRASYLTKARVFSLPYEEKGCFTQEQIKYMTCAVYSAVMNRIPAHIHDTSN